MPLGVDALSLGQGGGKTLPKKLEWLKNLKVLFRDASLDVNQLVNAELRLAEYFVTADHNLINKANNEGKGRLRIKVVSPRKFLEIYHAKYQVHKKCTI